LRDTSPLDSCAAIAWWPDDRRTKRSDPP
jgi:hypothetical protein